MDNKPVLKLTLVSYFNLYSGKLISAFVMADYSTGKAVVDCSVWSKITNIAN